MIDMVSSIALPSARHLLVAVVAALVIAGAARAARALTWGGAVASAVVGALIFGLGGGAGAVALLLFFATSTALGRVGRRRKEGVGFEKGGERDAAQVLANGGVAALCALLLPLFPGAAWLIAGLLGSLAEANADTWATEIGTLAARPPRMITTFQRAAPGRSGAVSVPGTLAALAGAALIAATAPLWHVPRPSALAFYVAVGGFAGALADSLLGATLQAQYRCPHCGRLTERRVHCGDHETAFAHGLPWLKNDGVNALSTLIGAGVAALLALFLA